jgi:hypothetical protein
MRYTRLLIVLCLVVYLGSLNFFSMAQNAHAEGRFKLYGHIAFFSQSQVQTKTQTLTAKLYPPKDRDMPVLLAYSDSTGRFQFTRLQKSTYLLEISLGDKVLYQKELNMESDILLAVPVGNLKLIDSVTVEEHSSTLVSGQEFQGNLKIEVGDIKNDLQPNIDPFSLTISQKMPNPFSKYRKTVSIKVTPPKLVTNFKYNNQTYILTGAIRKISLQNEDKEYMDCEIYK